ncbi:MAG: diguanylate cyclase [Firmicutes bacterium]|nr:diguanylate cyclase [Bacillota bacterium]
MFTCSNPVLQHESASALATVILKPIVRKNKIVDFKVKDWNHTFISYFGLECLYGDIFLRCLEYEGKHELVEMFFALVNAETPFTSKSMVVKLQGGYYFTTVVRHQGTYIFTFIPFAENLLRSNCQDELTGLFTRAYYDKQLEWYNQEKTWPLSLILLDINGLKTVNDSFGHETGDRYLQRVAAILKAMFQQIGFVARIGGDEFAVALPGVHKEELQALVRKLRFHCQEDKQQPFKINIAIGSASRRNEKQDIWAVVAKAENRLNQNKLFEGNNARWDGTGYPQGLKGEEIPLLARIISVLDAYDTMTHGRVYKQKLSQKEAIAEIKRQRGKQFDPRVVDVFLAMMEKEMLLKKLQQEREKLHKLADGQDFTSQDLLKQSRYVDQIINQIYRISKVEVKL